jgi:CIC family chloride channel protein
MTLTVAVAHGVRRALLAQNIYTMKLVRRGHYMPEALQANAILVHHVEDLAMAAATVLPAVATVKDAASADLPTTSEYFVLAEGERVVGVVRRDTVRLETLDPASLLADIARRDFAVVAADMTLFELMPAMKRSRAEIAVVGVVTKAHVAEALAEGMEIFGD